MPFGRGMTLRFFLGPTQPPTEGASVKLKSILKVLEDSPSLPPDLISLLRFAAEHQAECVMDGEGPMSRALPSGHREKT